MTAKAIALTVLAALTLTCGSAHAGGGGGFAGATEPTQILNNMELAMINVEEVTQTIQDELRNIQLIEQTYLGRLQQLQESIGQYTAPFQKAYDTYKTIKGYQTKLQNVFGKMTNYKNMLSGRFLEFSASQLDWRSWLDRERTLIQSGDKMAKSKLDMNKQVLEEAEESIKGYQDASKQMEETVGVHGATQVLGAQMSMVGSDIVSLRNLVAQANLVDAAKMRIDIGREKKTAIGNEALKLDIEANRRAADEMWNKYK